MFRPKGGSRCIEVGRLVQSYLDSELDSDTTAKVASHLDACRRCGLNAADYRQLKSALNETSAPLPADRLRRLQAFAADLATSHPPRE